MKEKYSEAFVMNLMADIKSLKVEIDRTRKRCLLFGAAWGIIGYESLKLALTGEM